MTYLKQQDYKICTLASHSALQILKGARDEGFKTIAICDEKHVRPYQSFQVADEIIVVKNFSELPSLDKKLAALNAVLIPHGSLINALDTTAISKLTMPYYGNKHILPWESNRMKQRQWLGKAGMQQPRIFAGMISNLTFKFSWVMG